MRLLPFLITLLSFAPLEAKEVHKNRKLQTASITITFSTDSAPEEIGWLLFDSRTGILISQASYGTYTTPEGVETVTLSVTENQFYTLQLIDSSSDGICCFNGAGNVFVFLGPEPTFDSVLAISDGKYGSQQFLSFQASANATTVIAPSAAPSDYPTTTSEPSTVPSIVPSNSPVPTTTTAPTESIIVVVLTIAIHTDEWPGEISWKLFDDNEQVVDERLLNFYFRNNAVELTTVLVTEGDDFTFSLADSYGDGILSGGDARVYLGFPDATLLVYASGNFGFAVSVDFVASISGVISAPSLTATTPPVAPIEIEAPITQAPLNSFAPILSTSFPVTPAFAPAFATSAPVGVPVSPIVQTFAPVIPPSGSVSLVDLGLFGCNPLFPCSVCQGDCDFDDDCAGNLVCLQRDLSTDPIPSGCSNNGNVILSLLTDFCSLAPVSPSDMPLLEYLGSSGCNSANPCGQCQGDCDADSDCHGNLKCFTRTSSLDPTPPGCVYGGDFSLDDWDFCYRDIETTPLPSLSPVTFAPIAITGPPLIFLGISGCSSSNLCNVCQGDCDFDSDCAPGLKCFGRVTSSSPIPPGCVDSGDFAIDDWDFCVFDESTVPPPEACPVIHSGGCAVCGDGLCVRNPDGIFEFPAQPNVPCGILEDAGANGLIPLDICFVLPNLIFFMCDCQPGSTPGLSPSAVPTSVSTAAPFAPSIFAPTAPAVSIPDAVQPV